MFQLTAEESARLRSRIVTLKMKPPAEMRLQSGTSSLRSQIVTSNAGQGRGGRRYRPYAFTEQGVAMLSSVLRSKRAVMVNIEIMRGGELRHTYKRRNVSERPSIAWYDLSNSRR